jgi:phosphoglycerate dehydrogenase-like enzyme
MSILVVEDDRFLRIVGLVLDPATSAERIAAFADFFAHDEPDFAGWCARLRGRLSESLGDLYPSTVRLVDTQEKLRAALPGARALVVETLEVGPAELAAGGDLRLVQKYGLATRNIDTAACAARGIKVLTLRRRANIACAELAIALMLTLARKLHRLAGRISIEQLADAGYTYKPFDLRHTANSNWPRVPGLRSLHGATIGILGLGEIGREIAIRAAAFGMRILYHQRRPLPDEEERALAATHVPLPTLLAESEWVVPQLPSTRDTISFIGAAELAQMKPGACLINISRPEVVDRTALLAALASGRLGGFALDTPYEEPGRSDDELLAFDNVVLTPHIAAMPRFNALEDFTEMLERMGQELEQ